MGTGTDYWPSQVVVGPILASSPAKSMSPNTPHLLDTSHDGVDISHTIDAMLGMSIAAEGRHNCQLQGVMHSLDLPGQESRRNTPARCTNASSTNSERTTVFNAHAPGEGKATQYVSQTTVQATGHFSSLKAASQPHPKPRRWYEPILKYFGGKTS